jgi:hypothetical protein
MRDRDVCPSLQRTTSVAVLINLNATLQSAVLIETVRAKGCKGLRIDQKKRGFRSAAAPYYCINGVMVSTMNMIID